MEKALDKCGRWRNITVGFRVSEEESELLNDKVSISGLTKQDYIIRRLLGWEVKVYGNPKVYKALKDQMGKILEELKRIEAGQIMDDDLIELIRIVAEVVGEMKEESEWR